MKHGTLLVKALKQSGLLVVSNQIIWDGITSFTRIFVPLGSMSRRLIMTQQIFSNPDGPAFMDPLFDDIPAIAASDEIE